MGTTELGKDWRLKVGDADAPIGGEKTFDWNRASNDVDTSDKDGPSGVLIPGRVSFAVQGTVKLPDPGIAAIYAASKTGAQIPLQAVKGAVVKYDGPVTVGNWKGSFPNDGPATYSFDMTAAAPATVDDLVAAA